MRVDERRSGEGGKVRERERESWLWRGLVEVCKAIEL